jgi:hypothetical protein
MREDFATILVIVMVGARHEPIATIDDAMMLWLNKMKTLRLTLCD